MALTLTPSSLLNYRNFVGGDGGGFAAIYADGTTIAQDSGNDTDGQFSGITGLSNAVELSISSNHSLALHSDGTVTGAGSNTWGALTGVSSLTNVVAISAGRLHSAFVYADGTVTFAGSNINGQSEALPSVTNAIQISSDDHNLILKADGTVTASGYNFHGQITGVSSLVDVVQVEAGAARSTFVFADGTVSSQGDNFYGAVSGINSANLTGVVSVAGRSKHTLVLLDNGTVVGFGRDDFGQVSGNPGVTDVVGIATSEFGSGALHRDGTITTWGRLTDFDVIAAETWFGVKVDLPNKINYLDYTNYGRVKYAEPRVPTTSELNAHVDEIFVDSTTGVHYTCLDDTEGAQVWRGTDNSLIEPIPLILSPAHPDLVAMYTMDTISGSTLVDETGNNDGTLFNTTSTGGLIGDALAFNASSSYVSVPIAVGSSLTAWGYSLWFKGTNEDIFGISTGGNWQLRIELASSSLTILVASGTLKSGQSLSDPANNWQHIIVTGTGTTAIAYLNGIVIASVTGINYSGGSVANIEMGRSALGGSQYFNGSIDQFRSFNKTLTQEEVTTLHNEGAP